MDKKGKSGELGKYLFNGNWQEKDGIKWAFFAEKDKLDSETDKSGLINEKSQNKKETPRGEFTFKKEEIKLKPAEKVSITELAKQSVSRYGSITPSIPSSGTLEPGTILSGRYKILELYKSLEKRDFYCATDTRLDNPCIVKELIGEFSTREEEEYYRLKFKNEAKLLADLAHPNLPKVIDYFIENNRCFMILEYIKGFDMLSFMRNRKDELTEEQIILWGVNICDVLEYLHNQDPPVIHRDINPVNLFIRERDKAVVVFNFATARRQGAITTKNVGTIGYTAPEQTTGHAEPTSDIFSLGATLHHMLTGIHPTHFQFKPVRELNSSISKYTEEVVKKALNIKIPDRFKTVSEMKESLLEAYKRLTQKAEVETSEETVCKVAVQETSSVDREKDKIRAIMELGKSKDPKSLKILIPLLKDRNPLIRLNVLSALLSISDKRAVPFIAKLLIDEDGEVRKKAVETIEKIMGRKMPPLIVVPAQSDFEFEE